MEATWAGMRGAIEHMLAGTERIQTKHPHAQLPYRMLKLRQIVRTCCMCQFVARCAS